MQRNFLLCRYIWQLMYVMESKIIQPFLKSMCPAPKSCHPSQRSATCNLFCLRVSHYVSARINCIVRSSRVPAAAPVFAEGLISDAASVFKGIGHWAGFYFIFRVFPFIFFGGVPLGAAPRLTGRMRLGWASKGTEAPGWAPAGDWGLPPSGLSGHGSCHDSRPPGTRSAGPEVIFRALPSAGGLPGGGGKPCGIFSLNSHGK